MALVILTATELVALSVMLGGLLWKRDRATVLPVRS
ncbi:MAG: hypothetical protein ACJAR2_001638 [Ilumatobacter sp.]|jgi:hypothetical protein